MVDATSCNPRTAASDAISPRRPRGALGRILSLLAGASTLAMMTACSTWSGLSGGNAPSAAATAPSDGSFTSRVKSFFSGTSGQLASPPPSSTTGAASTEIDCPSVEYRQGAATWTVNGPAAENSALGVKYQVSFLQTARECIVTGGNLTIKVGVQGRIVVGPAGGPGTLNIPVRYALVREGLQPKTLWTKLFLVPVSVETSDLNPPWVHVEEEMTVPRPSAEELDAYVIYVGFDPEGATSAKPKPAKPKTAWAR